MIEALSRQEVFRLSKMADITIADRQDFYFRQFEGEDPAVIASVRPYYDHLEPGSPRQPEMKFCILVYDEDLAGENYEQGFARSVGDLLAGLGIEKWILTQDLCRSWDEFGFDSDAYAAAFKALTKITGTDGMLIDQLALKQVFPLLFHNNPDQGDCSFYTLGDDFQLAMLYWKGNLHTSYYAKDEERLAAAVKQAKLLMGDRELAFNYTFGKRYG